MRDRVIASLADLTEAERSLYDACVVVIEDDPQATNPCIVTKVYQEGVSLLQLDAAPVYHDGVVDMTVQGTEKAMLKRLQAEPNGAVIFFEYPGYVDESRRLMRYCYRDCLGPSNNSGTRDLGAGEPAFTARDVYINVLETYVYYFREIRKRIVEEEHFQAAIDTGLLVTPISIRNPSNCNWRRIDCYEWVGEKISALVYSTGAGQHKTLLPQYVLEAMRHSDGWVKHGSVAGFVDKSVKWPDMAGKDREYVPEEPTSQDP